MGLYARQCAEGYHWLYPPYMLYPYAVASLLPPLAYYGLTVVEILAATGLGLWFLRRSLEKTGDFEMLSLLVLASAALNGTVVTGQHSAILLAAIAGAAWAMGEERPVVAGVFLGVLGIKPNWAAFFVLWLVVTRRWRELAAMAVVGAIMIASTLPLGLEVWREYLSETPRVIDKFLRNTGGQPVHKLITFEAFTRSTLGTQNEALGNGSWILLEIVAAIGALVAWFRARSAMEEVAMTVLVLVAANVYVVFYDALVLALPAAVWWMRRDRYPPILWWAIAAAASGFWLWQWFSLYGPWNDHLPSLAGGFLVIWIVAEALRLLRTPSTESHQRGASQLSAPTAG